MPAACRLNDKDNPHPHQDSITSASPNVLANNLGAARVGDTDSHSPPHTKTEGSPNVFVNNKPWVRIGDGDSGGNKMVEGSPNVFIN
jgi:uncharacterized Zn-binding protein involved in type VI secretion